MIREYVYTLEETAQLVKVNRATVHRWIQAGKLPSESIGGVVLIPRWAVEMLIEQREWQVISGDFYTIGEVAKMLKKHPNTIGRWVKEGKLPTTRRDNKALIRKEDLERIFPFVATQSGSAGEPDVGEGGP